MLAIFLLAILPGPLFARLGETEAQIEARYGQPSETNFLYGFRAEIFSISGMQIMVSFLDGKSAWEEYNKVDQSDLSDHEIDILMNANGQGKNWEQVDCSSFQYRMWRLEDRSALTTYDTVRHFLDIKSAAAIFRLHDARDEQESDNLKGF
jgi:hypothetical protein